MRILSIGEIQGCASMLETLLAFGNMTKPAH